MLEHMLATFKSFFFVPGLAWYQALIAIGLAFAFGTAWFSAYWTSILKKPWAWVVLVASALFTLVALCFVQIPLQWWTSQALNHFWSQWVLLDWLLLAQIPIMLLSGLVQEGAKLVPVVLYWWRQDRKIDPKTGLVLGAVAGLGFGVFEAVWVHNGLLADGWGWWLVEAGGVVALISFWSRLFAVGFHIAASALAGYGLAKGWGWQFYLIASGLHALLNYGLTMASFGLFGTIGLGVYIAVVTALVAAVVLWLRWRETGEEPSPAQISGAEAA